MFEDLAWLGLAWDEAPLIQSQRLGVYRAALEGLIERGLVYRCFRTRAETAAASASAPHGSPKPLFGAPLPEAEAERRAQAGEPFAWRLSLDRAQAELGGFTGLTFSDATLGEIAAEPRRAGDVVLARKDLGVSYHLACVIDDAASGVSLVVRGEDLREACHVQRLLQALLGLPAPAYLHHRLVVGEDGRRLAKRDNAQTLRALRAAGATPLDIRRRLGL